MKDHRQLPTAPYPQPARPTFLGIGAARAGSTWLHQLLAAHPQVFVPRQRKELSFFDNFYDRGLDYYLSFFPSPADLTPYRAIGEVSPTYLTCPECPARIAGLGSVEKLLVILRNPVDRAYSHYGLMIRDYNFKGSFPEFLEAIPSAIERGLYAHHLQRYLAFFRPDQILLLIFEEAVAEPKQMQEKLAAFLGLDWEAFGATSSHRNASNLSRFPVVYSSLTWLARRLRRYDLDLFVNLATRLGLKQLLLSDKRLPPLSHEMRHTLQPLFSEDIAHLKSLFAVDVDNWHVT